MKKFGQYILFTIVLFVAFVIWDWINYSNPNWVLNIVQTLFTVLIYIVFSYFNSKKKQDNQ